MSDRASPGAAGGVAKSAAVETNSVDDVMVGAAVWAQD
jgi:hypothetical protein